MRLKNMLDINHELIKLSKHIDWESLDKEWGALFVSTKGAPAIYQLDKNSRIGLAAGHISNADLGDTNEGAETAYLNYQVAF